MLGWAIFKHSVSMTIRNLQSSLQVFLVPWACLTGLIILLGGAVGEPVTLGTQFDVGGASANDAGEVVQTAGQFALLTTLLNIFVGAWTAVAWHRYILLEQPPSGWIPELHWNLIARYALWSILIGVAAVAAIAGPFLLLAVAEPLAVLLGIVLFGWMIYVCVIAARAAIVLPGIAVQSGFSVRDCLEKTKGQNGVFIVLGLSVFAFAFAVLIVVGLLTAILPALAAVAQLPISLVLTVLNVSILTTLYGVFVEGRELS